MELQGLKLKVEKEGSDTSYDFLGIHINKSIVEGKTIIKLTQLGLITKFLTTLDMLNCNPSSTPSTAQPLGTDTNGKRHFENWDYASAVGMLMYLAGNAYPEIQFAVHQCARFCHAPCHSHAKVLELL